VTSAAPLLPPPVTGYVLRDYQRRASDAGVRHLESGTEGGGILVEPTGCGKSLIIADMVAKLQEPTIVFQPSAEILEQNVAKFQSYGYSPTIYSASAGRKELGEVTFATIGSVFKKPELFSHIKNVIVDECHLTDAKNDTGMFTTFLNSMPGTRLLGLTATPYRLATDGYGGAQLKFLTRTRPRIFDTVVDVTQNGDLFRAGHLARIEYKEVATGFDAGQLRLNSTGADYTDESVQRHFKTLHFSDKIVRCVTRLHELGRKGTVVFTRFVEEATYVASKIPGAAVVSSGTKRQERRRILEAFKAGKITVLANVGIVSIGFDYPALANVVLAAPTMSLAAYYQRVGRVVRPHPDKDCAFVVDMVGLVKRFGKVEDLVVEDGGNGKWHVRTGKRHLTNVYFDKQEWRPQ